MLVKLISEFDIMPVSLVIPQFPEGDQVMEEERQGFALQAGLNTEEIFVTGLKS